MYTFLEKGVNPVAGNKDELPLDFKVLPQLIFNNLNALPKLFKQIQPEVYYGNDVELHVHLAGSISVIMNRRIRNPHMRIEFINFLQYLLPQKNVSSGQEKQNNLHK